MDTWAVLAIALFSLLVYLLIWDRPKRLDATGLPLFISGCDTGIGNRLAIYFSDLGCQVFAGCLDAEKARSTLPASVRVVPLDVTKEDSVRDAVNLVRKELEKEKKDLWALINNAGVCVYGQFEWLTWSQCERQVQVNLLGTMRLTKCFTPLLRNAKGRIITVTSINGSISYPGLSVYCATKFALEGFSHSLRLELGQQHGIRVILVQPGDYARVTCIMSQHEQNAQQMWDAMCPEDKHKYGDFFHKYHRVTMENYGLTSPSTIEGSTVIDNMVDAVLSPKPAKTYISAAPLHKLVYRLLALSPMNLTDYIFGKITEVMYKTDDKKIK